MAATMRCEQWLTAGVPKTRLAEQIGIPRNKLYAFLDPAKAFYKLSDDDLRLIADFEGRKLADVRADYLARRKAAA